MNFLHSKYYGFKSFLYNKIGFLFTVGVVYSFGMSLLDYYSSIALTIEDEVNGLYENNSYVKSGIDLAISYKNFVIDIFYDTYKEPSVPHWNNFISIIKKDKYKYFESYENLNSDEIDTLDISSTQSNITKILSNATSFLNNSNNTNHTCLISKIKGLYYVQVVPLKEYSFEKSNLYIISATYSDPSSNRKIDITLPKEYMVCNNYLFNAAFVYHLLKYSNQHFEFSEDYNIEIMDSNTDTYDIKYNQCFVVNKDSFEVKYVMMND